MPPGITVEKIPAGPPLPAPVEVRGKPVTGLAQVRLLHNLIVAGPEGKSILISRGEIVPIETVPEKWRTSEYIEAPDAFREGKVCLTHDMTFAVPSFDGQSTVWREKLHPAFSLVDLATFPNRIVEGLREGEDFLTEWDEDERKVKELERREATEEYSMEEPDPDVGVATNPHLRYGGSL